MSLRSVKKINNEYLRMSLRSVIFPGAFIKLERIP